MSDTLSFMVKSASTQMMGSLAAILAKGKAHADEAGVDESVFLNARLFPNMFPVVRQVQIATDILGRGASRLAGGEMPSNPDVETSFDELIARCQRVDKIVQDLNADLIDKTTLETIEFPMGDMQMKMAGREYFSRIVLPNLHFHTTTTYALLRHQGVVLGKRDYLAGALSQ